MPSRRALNLIAAGAAGIAMSLSSILPPGAVAEGVEVDLALILAIDCSFSVDQREFALQMQGLGLAFRREEVKRAIAQGSRGRIAVTAVQWSDDQNQAVVLPWTVVSGGTESDALGQHLANLPRQLAEGGTSIAAALTFSAALFEGAPAAERRVVDVSTDGRNNSGPRVAPVRDALMAQGITINALTILNEWPTLNIYAENNVIGGAGSFAMPANDYEAYGEAIFRKLLREITGPGIS
ncbi:DUF1194 domain-containing protein [Aestuariivirga sp.]|uniref:DUF1194 domain-containing protein n=1 Tax=Aestuariivirga sp. TaxID=2650926 RepID=UPI00391D56D9